MFWYKAFWIITLIILLVVYILGKSKYLIVVISYDYALIYYGQIYIDIYTDPRLKPERL